MTPLACNPNITVENAKLLLEAGADMNAKGDHGLSVIERLLIKNKNKPVIYLLISKGAEISSLPALREVLLDQLSPGWRDTQ